MSVTGESRDAVTFSPHGAQVSVTAHAAEPEVVASVADHGPGIPRADLDRVFERFYKADSARVRTEGSGLGLAITAENVQLHGGTIRVANRPGGGAVFTVCLPLWEDRSEEAH